MQVYYPSKSLFCCGKCDEFIQAADIAELFDPKNHKKGCPAPADVAKTLAEIMDKVILESDSLVPCCIKCRKPMKLMTIRTGPRCKDVRAQYWECRSYHKQ